MNKAPSSYDVRRRLRQYANELGDTVHGAGILEASEDMLLIFSKLRGRNVQLVRELENMSREYARLNSLYEILNRIKSVDDSDLTCWDWESGYVKNHVAKVQFKLPEEDSREFLELLDEFFSKREEL